MKTNLLFRSASIAVVLLASGGPAWAGNADEGGIYDTLRLQQQELRGSIGAMGPIRSDDAMTTRKSETTPGFEGDMFHKLSYVHEELRGAQGPIRSEMDPGPSASDKFWKELQRNPILGGSD